MSTSAAGTEPSVSGMRMNSCLAHVYLALGESQKRQFDLAKRIVAQALAKGVGLPDAVFQNLRAMFAGAALLIRFRESAASVTPELRAQLHTALDRVTDCESNELYPSMMFDILAELGELRRAILFGERALARAVEANESERIASLLSKIGRCYADLGLRDHAAIAYRGAVRIFRHETADPRLASVLLALGNSIRKSDPQEAERLYKEAADFWEKKGQLESATPAWSNLALVCSDQERFDEALNYYERVRRVRESNPGTPAAHIGRLYNNIASCYRKMGRFTDAHRAIERSIEILTRCSDPVAANSLADVFGTKGMIFRDEGRDLESLEWARRSCAEWEKRPSPNAERYTDDLRYLADALRRLNRMEEVITVEEKIESVRRAAADVPSITIGADGPVKLADGAVLIEIELGMRSRTPMDEILKLGHGIGRILGNRVWVNGKAPCRVRSLPRCSITGRTLRRCTPRSSLHYAPIPVVRGRRSLFGSWLSSASLYCHARLSTSGVSGESFQYVFEQSDMIHDVGDNSLTSGDGKWYPAE